MARTGRKPLAAGHVDHLQGSDRARQRMKLILECMQGQLTVPEACQELGISESRFHAMRNQWLQESLELLEPRRTGRPPKPLEVDSLLGRIAELEADKRALELQLRRAEAREQITTITASSGQAAVKKIARRARRRRAPRQPR